MDAVNQMNDKHAMEHADCTKPEVIGILQTNAAGVLDYLASLHDSDLERQGYLGLFDRDFGAGELFTVLLMDIAGAHFDSMKTAVE